MRTDPGQIRDKFNLSNDHFYEVAKEGGRHRVRQTFGQLVVEHAYPAQKLQLPFVSPPQRSSSISSETSRSTKLDYQNKKLVRSTDLPYNSLQTSNYDSVKFAQQRRRRIKLDESLVKVAISARAFGRRVILAFAILQISSFGSILYAFANFFTHEALTK